MLAILERHRWILVVALIALALGGCRRRRHVNPTLPQAGQTSGGTPVNPAQQWNSGVIASGTPREQLEQYDRVMRGFGYMPAGPATHGSLPPNGLRAYAIDVARGYCYTVAIFGAPGADINLVMIDSAGRDIQHDVRPDEHPWVSFCAARSGRFVARVQMNSGEGEFFFAPYLAQGRGPVQLTGFFGGAQSNAPATAELDAETRQRLERLDQELASDRFQRIAEPAGLVLTERQERVFQLALEQDRCYTFAALGGPGTTDTDVSLENGAGQRLEADTRPARDAQVRYCAPEGGNYTLHVGVHGGNGPVFTAGYVQQAETPTPAAEEEVAVMSETSTEGAGLAESFQFLDGDMRARGYIAMGEPENAPLGEGQARNYAIELEREHCYAIAAVGDAGVRNLTLSIQDAGGRELDRDIAQDSRPSVRVCPPMSGEYTITLRMESGAGQYTYAAYRWPRGTRLGDLAGVLYVRLAEVTALLSVEEYQPDAAYSIARGRLRAQGERETHTIQLTQGQCYSVVVVGGEGVRDLDITLASGGSVVAAETSTRTAFPSVRYCPTGSGEVLLAVSANVGSGDYVYQVFSRGAR